MMMMMRRRMMMVKVKGKVVPCLTKHHAMNAYWGSGVIAPRILDPGTRWRWVVSFTHRPLYPPGKSPWYPLDRRLREMVCRDMNGIVLGQERSNTSYT
jgi:hypothetical protein